jgi:histidinol-phosphate/aromatic aminotransferase/cobyric acid decarboxylase-like protein
MIILSKSSRAVLTPGDKIVTSEATFGQYYHNAIVESAKVVKASKPAPNKIRDSSTFKCLLIAFRNDGEPVSG